MALPNSHPERHVQTAQGRAHEVAAQKGPLKFLSTNVINAGMTVAPAASSGLRIAAGSPPG